MIHITALSIARLASGNPHTWGPVAEAACGAPVSWVGGRRPDPEPTEIHVVIHIPIAAADITPEMIPTCPACAVLLDAALEGAGTTSGPSRP